MKILCVIDTFRIGGGAQTQMAGLAAMLKSYGHNVVALSYYKNPPEKSFEPYLKESGVIYKCLDRAYCMYDKLIGVKQVIADFSPDTVIAYIDGPTSICCILKALGGRFRLIVSERNVTQRISFRERVKFHLYRFADVIVPNAYAQERFIINKYPFLSSKLHTISNFVDTDIFYPAKTTDKIDKERLDILVVARINPQKNILRFLDTLNILLKRNVPFHVDWFGRPSLMYFEECLCRIKDLKLEENISFYDAVKDIDNVYRNSKYDVYCLPSLFEGCPNTLGEAMASGLPVLCSNVCDNSIYVKSGENGLLFDPLSSEDMSNTIIAFSNISFENRVRMGENSRRISMEMLSKEVFISEYLKII